MLPRWTVHYNVVSPENNQFVGTGWEFFDNERDAQICYNRQAHNGNVPTKRPFYPTDGEHLGAAHTEIKQAAAKTAKEIQLICLKAKLSQLEEFVMNEELNVSKERDITIAQIRALEEAS